MWTTQHRRLPLRSLKGGQKIGLVPRGHTGPGEPIVEWCFYKGNPLGFDDRFVARHANGRTVMVYWKDLAAVLTCEAPDSVEGLKEATEADLQPNVRVVVKFAFSGHLRSGTFVQRDLLNSGSYVLFDDSGYPPVPAYVAPLNYIYLEGVLAEAPAPVPVDKPCRQCGRGCNSSEKSCWWCGVPYPAGPL